MDLQRLRVLLEVERCGSFAAAADALHFTPSAVSQQIARLEAEAGVRLVDRGRAGARLTDAGRGLAGRARIALDQLEQAREELAGHGAGRLGRLRLCAFPTAASTFVAQAIGAFHRAHPDVRLSLRTAESWDALGALSKREADVAVLVGFPGEDLRADPRGTVAAPAELVDLEPLFDDPLVLAVPAGHPLAAAPAPLAATDIAAAPLLGALDSPGVGAYVGACARDGVEPELSPFVFNDFHVVQSLVAAGLGVALVPALATMASLPGLAYVPLGAWAPRRRVWLALRPDGPPTATAMAAILRDLAATAPDGWVSAERPPGQAVPNG